MCIWGTTTHERWFTSFSPPTLSGVGRLQALPQWVWGVWDFSLLVVEVERRGKGNPALLSNALRSTPSSPVQLFGQLGQQWGAALKSSLPRGSIWPAAPSGQLSGQSSTKESQGPCSALTRVDEVQGRLLVTLGDRSEENSSSGTALERGFCNMPI